MSRNVQQQLWELAEPVVLARNLHLVELEYVRQKEWVVRLFLERPDVTIIPGLGVAPGEGIGLGECAEVGRELSALLDVADVVHHEYRLEVSSPGVQRPLRKLDDFVKFCGCQVRVKSFSPVAAIEPKGASPSRNFFGILEQVDRDLEHIEVTVDGRRYHIPLEQITKAHIEPDMDQWMALAIKKRKEAEEA